MPEINWRYSAESAESILRAANARIEAVRALAERWKTGVKVHTAVYGPGPEVHLLDGAASELLAILNNDH